MWLWLWRRLAAVAPIHPLAWEPPYALGATLKKKERKGKKRKKKKWTIFKLLHDFALFYCN